MNKKSEKKNEWGFDQAIVNYLFYKSKLTKFKLIEPSQLVSFDIFSGLEYNKEKKSLYIKGTECSSFFKLSFIFLNIFHSKKNFILLIKN